MGSNVVQLRRNRVWAFLERDVLEQMIATHEYTLSEMEGDNGWQESDFEEERQIIDTLKLLLVGAADIVEGFDPEDTDRYNTVLDRIDEVARC